MKTTSSNIFTIAAFSLATAFAGQVAAQGVSEPSTADVGITEKTISIVYAPAEAFSETGRENLYSKIRHAAKEVCGPTGLREAGSLSIASRNRKCYDESLAQAMGQVYAKQVAAVGQQ